MSEQNDFESQLTTLQAIPTDAIRSRGMPVDVYLQEAEDLYQWALKDNDRLQSAGLGDWVEQLSLRIGLLREAEGRWQVEYQARQEAGQEWAEKSTDAFELRDHLLRSFRYAFRHHPELLKKVGKIAEGDTQADMIQDLSSLAILGRQHTELLAAINLNADVLETAATTADTMAQVLARANAEKLGTNESLRIRDQAYTHLYEAVEEVRACGRYVFFNEQERLKGYFSAYVRNRNATYSANKKAGTDSDETETVTDNTEDAATETENNS